MSEVNKVIPELRFPEFKDEGEWNEKTIDNIKSVLTDYVANGSFQSLRENLNVLDSDNYAYYVRLTDLRAGLGHLNQKYVDENTYNFLNKSSLFGGELLMANIGANVGEVWQMPYTNKPATLAPNMIMIKFRDEIDSGYIYQYLTSDIGVTSISSVISGSGHPKISKTDLRQVKVLLPSQLLEQQKIASCLSSLDVIITAHSQKLELLKEHKKSLMQNLFPQEGEIVPTYRFPEFENDVAWEENQLGDAVKFNSGGTPSKEVSEYWNGNIPWISASSMHDLVADKSELYITDIAVKDGASISKKGNILILVRGSMLFKRIPICIAGMDVSFNQDVKSLELKREIDNVFFLYLLISNEAKLLESVTSTGIGAGKLDTDGLKKLTLKVPSNKVEQQKIASCLSTADELIAAQADKIDQLKLHKKGLMQALFPKMDK